jgi:hypothetical protein
MTTAAPSREIAADNPLGRLSTEQIEAIGREFDEIRDRVLADLGERDRRYIESMIEMHRRLAVVSRVLLLAPVTGPPGRPERRLSRRRRSSRTWRSATTCFTASGTG